MRGEITEFVYHHPLTRGVVRISVDDKATLTQYEKDGWIRQGSADEMTPTGVEKQLEAETGHNFVKTGDDPITLAETDKPAPKAKDAAEK